jgi:hypothetical protein
LYSPAYCTGDLIAGGGIGSFDGHNEENWHSRNHMASEPWHVLTKKRKHAFLLYFPNFSDTAKYTFDFTSQYPKSLRFTEMSFILPVEISIRRK